MKPATKFELQPVSNGYLLSFYEWKIFDEGGVPVWSEIKSEVHFVLQDALDSIKSYITLEGVE